MQATSTAAANALGCSDRATALACVRRLPVSKLLAQTGAATAAAWGTPALPADPATAAPVQPGLPVLSGTTHDEQRFVAATFALLGQPITARDYRSLLAKGFGDRASSVARQYPASAYPSPAYAWAAAYTDSGFVCPQIATDDRLARRNPVTGYEFDDPTAPPIVPAPPGFDEGASHASELYYLFDVTPPPTRITGAHYGLTSKQRAVANTMIDAWSAFARAGHPGPSSWPTWNTSATIVHQFTADATHPGRVDLAVEHHCSFWQH